ncbi:plastid-lipid-associated protein, chloroplastic-like [Actinidia eriantha]|uniref:plastid-lipid-associated protein, chloroplastic-like n=1 Tax=Actinidia eriantha TaxID=165200 RepID=UPI0025898FCB|nr:plastid-lipid-associated protein, chloroplastic-like [Actinidia eriantha]
MTGATSFSQFSCNPVSVTEPRSQFSTKPALFPANSIRFTSFSTAATAERAKISLGARRIIRVRAVSENELGPEREAGDAVAVAKEERPTEVDLLKQQLVDSFYGTDRGLRATSETRAEIVELITKLEAMNPTPAPTEALTLLNGKWILAYTSFVGLYPLLSRAPPLVKVEEISQTIDSENFTVQNSVMFSGPLATTSISTNAKFEVQSPKRVQIKFEEGIISTPKLTDSIVFPENVEFLGQKIDLTPLKGIITSVQDTASSVAKTISSQPPLKFSISNSNAESWLLTTYLDKELRISRGDAGSVFVLVKDGCFLLTP